MFANDTFLLMREAKKKRQHDCDGELKQVLQKNCAEGGGGTE